MQERRRLPDHDHPKRIVLGVLNEELEHFRHENPVRAGLVERATDWKWSSARWYEWRRSVGVPIDWVE